MNRDITERLPPSPHRRSIAPGLSLVEILIAITIFVVIVGMALLLRGAHKSLETESGGLGDAAGRQDRDRDGARFRNVQQAGYGISRVNNFGPGRGSATSSTAGSHAIAFNADIDSTKGVLSPRDDAHVPATEARTRVRERPSLLGAETYVYDDRRRWERDDLDDGPDRRATGS